MAVVGGVVRGLDRPKTGSAGAGLTEWAHTILEERASQDA